MDFVTATDRLTACPTHEEIAVAAGVSIQGVRQARLSLEATGYRRPPPGWQRPVARLARERAADLVKLADELEAQEE